MRLPQLIWQRLEDGGIYMFPIFLLSVVMFAMIVRHFLNYQGLKRSLGDLRKGNGGRREFSGDDPLTELVEQYRRSRCFELELNVRLREEILQNFFTRTGAEGKSVILCGSIAMLMGLLGTVSGMINTFEAIQIFGVGNTKSFAVGISEALLTTQSGLLVGVVGLAAGHTIKRMHKKMTIKLYRYFDELEDGESAGSVCHA